MVEGKIGIWPFTYQKPAERSSWNRFAGTLETKNLSVTKEVYKYFLFNKVYPAIRQKWPDKRVFVRVIQDKATPQIKPGSPEAVEEGQKYRWNISLTNQPPNSPDFNINDLGFCPAIQALKYKSAPRNIDELVNAVYEAFNAFLPGKLNDTFLSLQKCMESSLFKNVGNTYKQPHLSKSHRRYRGEDIEDLVCDNVAYNLARNIVNES